MKQIRVGMGMFVDVIETVDMVEMANSMVGHVITNVRVFTDRDDIRYADIEAIEFTLDDGRKFILSAGSHDGRDDMTYVVINKGDR